VRRVSADGLQSGGIQWPTSAPRRGMKMRRRNSRRRMASGPTWDHASSSRGTRAWSRHHAARLRRGRGAVDARPGRSRSTTRTSPQRPPARPNVAVTATAAPTRPIPKAYRKPISPVKASRISRETPIHQTHGSPSLFRNFTAGL